MPFWRLQNYTTSKNWFGNFFGIFLMGPKTHRFFSHDSCLAWYQKMRLMLTIFINIFFHHIIFQIHRSRNIFKTIWCFLFVLLTPLYIQHRNYFQFINLLLSPFNWQQHMLGIWHVVTFGHGYCQAQLQLQLQI